MPTNVAQVLDAVMRYSDRTAGEENEHLGQQLEVLNWAAAIDDTGLPCPHLFVVLMSVPDIHSLSSCLNNPSAC